jgi:hypothetical protein
MSVFNESNASWIQSIVEATEQYDHEYDLQRDTELAKESDMARVSMVGCDLDALQDHYTFISEGRRGG